jgi:hypothetical protein
MIGIVFIFVFVNVEKLGNVVQMAEVKTGMGILRRPNLGQISIYSDLTYICIINCHTTPKASRLRVCAGSVRLPLSLSCLTRLRFGGGVVNKFGGVF